ncbi:MAG: STAS domain-containing protein [Leptospiraceae bacterium]|nr:STAS domain-containing protein [Leptospiraceae bacterium]
MIELVLSRSPNQVVRITEDLKMENAREFYEDFLAVHEPGVTEVFLDFREVRFVDSSGIGILLKCEKDLKDRGASISIFGLGKSLHSVFKLAGLLPVLSHYDDEEMKAKFPELFSS